MALTDCGRLTTCRSTCAKVWHLVVGILLIIFISGSTWGSLLWGLSLWNLLLPSFSPLLLFPVDAFAPSFVFLASQSDETGERQKRKESENSSVVAPQPIYTMENICFPNPGLSFSAAVSTSLHSISTKTRDSLKSWFDSNVMQRDVRVIGRWWGEGVCARVYVCALGL